ncbi:hypothetical protein HY249_01875, partial [Candidatus Azambacteria bacterium]|nr:hypothetical protein [Candidatus Azambacteria bacterium]
HFSDVKLIDRNNPFGLLATIMFYSGLDEGLKDTLKSLLKDPLKDSRFRATFNDYFKNHEISQIRIAGTKWLSEVLVWEE